MLTIYSVVLEFIAGLRPSFPCGEIDSPATVKLFDSCFVQSPGDTTMTDGDIVAGTLNMLG